MAEKLKESVSALMDNAADELELRRILAQSHDLRVAETWQRYHQLRAALHHEEARWVGIDLRRGINAVLDETVASPQTGAVDAAATQLNHSDAANALQNFPVSKAAGHKRKPWWSGVAIAASVAFAVVMAVQFGEPSRQAEPVVAVSPLAGDPVIGGSGNSDSVNQSLIVAGQDSAQNFSKEHEARLNEYIMRHTGHAALNTGKSVVPFARLTSFEPEEE